MVNLAVVGYGYWGPNLVRNFMSAGATVKCIVDLSENRLALARSLYPSINTSTDINTVINDNNIDAIVIALPVHLHYPIAKLALENGKHVLVEKPMTDSAKTSYELIELANKYNKVLMCDHTFLYTGAVRKICELCSNGGIGKLEYFDSVRINLGLFQSDINVIWDLAPHDISILSFLVDEAPYSVVATGQSHTSNNIENIAYLTMFYQSNFIAHVNVSWISPVKIRKILLGGDDKMIVYDDIEPTEKVKVYDCGYKAASYEDQNRLKIDYRTGDIFIPKLDTTEALKAMAQDFLNAIMNQTQPVADATLAYRVVQLLEASEKSIKNKGKEVLLNGIN